MAADQRRKRLNGGRFAGSSFRDQYRTKKKKMESSENDLNTKSHISLEWDGNQKRVVAKKEQISISRRDLRPFIDSVPHSHSIVADVLAIPREVFDLENLTEVLSYEVWQTQLSENEKKFLMQFLPTGQDAEQVVQALLDGDNFQFGNPFLKWGASLCSGNLHPDAVRCREQGLKADKKAHYSELQKYHNDIIECLQKLKERWESCKDPENEIVQKIWRPRREMEKRISSHANESRVRDVEQDVTATSESCSWVADEKACSSDNQYSSVMKGGGIQKRMEEKVFMKEKSRNPMTASHDVLNVGARPKNGDKLQRSNLKHSDGAKYMSYFKISKTQHQLVKSMKQSGKSIQSRSLNRVLGNLDSLHVQPYEVFVKEEQKKLHEHWLQLANEHLPVAHANWRARQLQRREMTKSLELDMKDKLNLVEDEEKETPENILQDHKYDGETNFESNMEDEEESIPGSPQNRSPQLISSLNGGHEFDTVDVESENNHVTSKSDDASSDVSEPSGNLNIAGVTVSQEAPHSSGGDVWPAVSMPHSYYDSTASHEYISASGLSLTQPQGTEEQCSHLIDLESELHEKDTGKDIIQRQSENNHATLKSDDASSDVSGSSGGNLIAADVAVSQGAPQSSVGDVWSAVSMPHSYYDSTASHKYTSASGLSLTHPQGNEQQRCRLIDLESDLHENNTGKDIIHRRSDDGSFNSYPNQDRNELLQSFFMDQGVLSYNHEPKRSALDFQPPNNVLMEDGQFSGHFQEPALPLEQGQKSQSDIYMQHNILENIYSDGGRYLIPRQEHLPPVNVQDWTINPVRMSSSLQPHLNSGELLSQNWFSREHQVRGGWSGSDGVSVPTQSMGSGNNADQIVLSHCNQLRSGNPYDSMGSAEQIVPSRNFSVLSHCNQLRSGSPYDSMGSAEQIVSSRNYGMVGGGTHGISNTFPQVSHPLDYLGGREAATSLMPDDVGWMNLQHQNSALHDPMGRPYLRSWNQ